MAYNYIGLDIETSGTELNGGARIIQIGICLPNKETYVSYINPGEMVWSDEAEQIHKISHQTVINSQLAIDVDKIVYQFLVDNGISPDSRSKNIPVGWNVASFDMPFLKYSLPKTHSLFSRRAAELNSICFALEGKNGRNSDTWKKNSKKYAVEQIGSDNAHDAGWDALMSLYCFEYLKEQIKEC